MISRSRRSPGTSRDTEPVVTSSAFQREALRGFFEWENPNGEQFGLERLSEAIRQAKDQPAGDIIASLYSAVLQFVNGTEQQDDLTALIVKRDAA